MKLSEVIDASVTDTVESIASRIRDVGIVRIPEFLKPHNNVLCEALFVLQDEEQGTYNFGKAARLGNLRAQAADRPSIFRLFNSQWMYDISCMYYGSPSIDYCQEIFLTHDYLSDNGLARNGYLHFDRLHTFKFFLYLTDCNSSSGAFSCIPGSRQLGEDLRKGAWKLKDQYPEVPNRIEIDYPELEITEEQVTPIEGAAGTLLIFDSDVLHLGGKVQKGKERVIVRSHTRRI